MCDFFLFVSASHATALAIADVHGLKELPFAVHALKLDESIAGVGSFSLRLSILDDERFGLDRHFFYFFLSLPNL